jgi:hypothetical protein
MLVRPSSTGIDVLEASCWQLSSIFGRGTEHRAEPRITWAWRSCAVKSTEAVESISSWCNWTKLGLDLMIWLDWLECVRKRKMTGPEPKRRRACRSSITSSCLPTDGRRHTLYPKIRYPAVVLHYGVHLPRRLCHVNRTGRSFAFVLQLTLQAQIKAKSSSDFSCTRLCD